MTINPNLQVVRVVHVLALDTVASADGPVLIVDGGSAEMPWGTEGDILEAELVGKLTWGGFVSSNNLVQALAELGLPAGGS